MDVNIEKFRGIDRSHKKEYGQDTFSIVHSQNPWGEIPMKHTSSAFPFFALLVVVLVFPFTVFAAELPADYNKEGNLTETIVCDQGKTTVKIYTDEKTWILSEIAPASGNTLIFLQSTTQSAFFRRHADSTQMTETTFEEFDPAFASLAPLTRNGFLGIQNDCVTK